jgi:HlyD family secretion protein
MSSAVSISTATHDNVVMVPIQAVTSREAKKKEQKAAPREGTMQVATAGSGNASADAKPASDKPATDAKPAGDAKTASKDEPPTTASTGKPKPVKVVFVVDKDGVAQMREVKTGIASRTDIEVLEGIAEGDKVVDGPYRILARELQEGQKVKEQPKGGPGGPQKGPPGGRS